MRATTVLTVPVTYDLDSYRHAHDLPETMPVSEVAWRLRSELERRVAETVGDVVGLALVSTRPVASGKNVLRCYFHVHRSTKDPL